MSRIKRRNMNSFFAPGRTELAGNHTDHQKGRVLLHQILVKSGKAPGCIVLCDHGFQRHRHISCPKLSQEAVKGIPRHIAQHQHFILE